jgi:chromosome segregation ATPase
MKHDFWQTRLQHIEERIISIEVKGDLIETQRTRLKDELTSAKGRKETLLQGEARERNSQPGKRGQHESTSSAVAYIEQYIKSIEKELSQVQIQEATHRSDLLQLEKLRQMKSDLESYNDQQTS